MKTAERTDISLEKPAVSRKIMLPNFSAVRAAFSSSTSLSFFASLTSRAFLASFAFLAVLAVPAVFASTGKGGQPGAFLSWGAGARSLGMGKAFVSVTDDATATLWNPGALALVDQKEITALHAILWADTSYDFLSYVHPTLDYGTFGLSVLFLNSSGFEGRSSDNILTQDFSDSQFAAGLSYGTNIVSTFAISLGGNIKYYSHNTAGSNNGNIILDFGFLSNPFENFKAALNIQNLVSMKIGEDTQDVLPILGRFGISHRLISGQLLIAADLDSQINWYLGMEYKLFSPSLGKPFQIAVRLGINYEEFTVGFGASYKEYSLDYAFSTHELGGSHRFSAAARFGDSISLARNERMKSEDLARTEESNSAYKRAVEDYKTGTYTAALEKVTKSLELKPENTDSQSLQKKLKTVVPMVPKETGDTRESELIRKGINYYVDGDVQSSLDILNYVLYVQPENDKIKKLYKSIGEEVGLAVTVSSESGVDIVKEKLLKALGLFYEGKFTDVIKLCNEVLRMEPANTTALERMGSSYYKLGQKLDALKVWEKAYMLNPDNKVLLKFVDKIKKELQDAQDKNAKPEAPK
ncbi:MAG: hypothetical protein A2452_05890 [Candidatus Firestonebacteria bacterium RIFOXYC2_FULL_39_67]|nr:MAG: hypothetical protein A2536_12575 [Candidatus Firestonebacteria bacterium RIFOXYD2_FULL_39_29]OGF56620.1 MAG: hypothetical protein A2452_05890 [Candidatus Firestonebacteria bacterium RIFOXYC2_FULL_39_67]